MYYFTLKSSWTDIFRILMLHEPPVSRNYIFEVRLKRITKSFINCIIFLWICWKKYKVNIQSLAVNILSKFFNASCKPCLNLNTERTHFKFKVFLWFYVYIMIKFINKPNWKYMCFFPQIIMEVPVKFESEIIVESHQTIQRKLQYQCRYLIMYF